MTATLGLIRPPSPTTPEKDTLDAMLFTTAFAAQGVDTSLLVPWETRAVEVNARPLDASHGTPLLQALWAQNKNMLHLDPTYIARMERFLVFAKVSANRDLIRQDEYGNFMVVLLNGSIAVDRLQPWGERLRLAEATPGTILGEMSLLDSGLRFSLCTTLSECDIAVLSAESMDQMLKAEPTLSAHFLALLARKLSLRLRLVSARLSEQK